MTRKDYINLAAALKAARPVRNALPQWHQWHEDVNAVADMLERSTRKDYDLHSVGGPPREGGFDRRMFLQNCGVTT